MHADHALAGLDNIMATPLDDLYPSSDGDRHFVYLHCDPTKPLNVKENVKHLFLATRFPGLRYEPFYVGKGKGNRHLDFNRSEGHRKIRTKILRRGLDIVAIKIAEGFTESAAFAMESKLIDVLGIRSYSKHGLLVNLDEGLDSQRRRDRYPACVAVRAIMKGHGLKI